MIAPEALVRVQTPQAARVAALLARAFQNDPMMLALIPDARQRRRLLPRVITWNVTYACRYGEVYATPGWEGAAVWLPPGATAMTLRRILRAGLFVAPFQVSWRVLQRLAASGDAVARLHHQHAPMPHWYLSQLGVDPTHQRRGFASALLRPLLARLDAGGLPCYLETAQPANLPLYQRFGFAVVGEHRLARGNVALWALLRRA